jgi:hypothetical protein
MTETRYQRIAREQAERQKARKERYDAEQARYEKAMRAANRRYHQAARIRRRERAYEDWCTSDFPNQPDD